MSYRSLASVFPLPQHVARLVWKLERHYLQPAHALFRLPVPNYRILGEFQFGIAHLLMAAIAGVSTTLYRQSGSNGQQFRQLLTNYYPFALEPANATPPMDAARILWSVFRNPLAHDLGFDVEKHAKTPETKLLRVLTKTQSGMRGLTEKMIEKLEDSSSRPTQKPTLVVRSDATVLFVDVLYWGVRCMMEKILADTNRVQRAEKFLTTL